jgi:hypothetical protein
LVIAIAFDQIAGSWTARQVHDTVAAIASEPRYAGNARASLFGRLVRFLWNELGDLIQFIRGTVDARIVLALAIAVVVVIIVARVIVAQRIAENASRRRSRGGARLDGRADYWTRARDEAAAGRYAEACHFVYAAVIDGLSRQGLVTYHSSKTSGDYARDLRRTAPPSYADFRSFARQFDRVIFRESNIAMSDYEQLRESAERASNARATA